MSQYLTSIRSHEGYDSTSIIYLSPCLPSAASFFFLSSIFSTFQHLSVSSSFYQPITLIPFTKAQQYIYDRVSPEMRLVDYIMTNHIRLLASDMRHSIWHCCRCGFRNVQPWVFSWPCLYCKHRGCGRCW